MIIWMNRHSGNPLLPKFMSESCWVNMNIIKISKNWKFHDFNLNSYWWLSQTVCRYLVSSCTISSGTRLWIPHGMHVNVPKGFTMIPSGCQARSICSLRFKSWYHLKSFVTKVVVRMGLDAPQHQCWTHNLILPLRCGQTHHKGSLNSTKFVLICKLCLVTHNWPLNNMKFVSKMM